MIWELAANETRCLDLWAVVHGTLMARELSDPRTGESGDDFLCLRRVTMCKVPSIFHACGQSRRIALKHYKLEFGSSHQLAHGMHLTIMPQIYVNRKSDIICPMASQYLPNIMERTHSILRAPGITKIAIDIHFMPDVRHYLFELPSIKETVLYGLPKASRVSIHGFEFHKMGQYNMEFRPYPNDCTSMYSTPEGHVREEAKLLCYIYSTTTGWDVK